jgi:hypothetical protein
MAGAGARCSSGFRSDSSGAAMARWTRTSRSTSSRRARYCCAEDLALAQQLREMSQIASERGQHGAGTQQGRDLIPRPRTMRDGRNAGTEASHVRPQRQACGNGLLDDQAGVVAPHAQRETHALPGQRSYLLRHAHVRLQCRDQRSPDEVRWRLPPRLRAFDQRRLQAAQVDADAITRRSRHQVSPHPSRHARRVRHRRHRAYLCTHLRIQYWPESRSIDR